MGKKVLHIKNMVCRRCIRVVSDELNALGLEPTDIELGRVTLAYTPDDELLERIRRVLSSNGFELIDDRKSRIIDRIKTVIIERVHYSDDESLTINWSAFISSELGYDYSYLSKLFSSVEGLTLERYIINQKIERAKELLVYDELTLNEISFLLGYSSVQHLSNQFKKVTGLSPTSFKRMSRNSRKPLDEV